MSKYNKIVKPWGYENIVENNGTYVLKEIFMKKGNRCSLQYHERKVETIYVIKGSLEIVYGNKISDLTSIILNNCESITIENFVIHRMCAIDEDSLYLEASTSYLDDVVRIEDDYGRNA